MKLNKSLNIVIFHVGKNRHLFGNFGRSNFPFETRCLPYDTYLNSHIHLLHKMHHQFRIDQHEVIRTSLSI